MAWTIEFDKNTKKDFRKIAKLEQQKIFSFLKKLVTDYDSPKEIGKPLKGEFAGLWRYRVGNYRLICTLEHKNLIVLVLHVGHRKAVYKGF